MYIIFVIIIMLHELLNNIILYTLPSHLTVFKYINNELYNADFDSIKQQYIDKYKCKDISFDDHNNIAITFNIDIHKLLPHALFDNIILYRTILMNRTSNLVISNYYEFYEFYKGKIFINGERIEPSIEWFHTYVIHTQDMKFAYYDSRNKKWIKCTLKSHDPNGFTHGTLMYHISQEFTRNNYHYKCICKLIKHHPIKDYWCRQFFLDANNLDI